ncbi:MAG: HAD family hydrolase [Chitinophagales bacterium]
MSSSKTLFLDRDGVINRRIVDGYVTKWSEFEFLPGVLDALKIFPDFFHHIIIVTNQRGIARGLYTLEDLDRIHTHMLDEIRNAGGRVDAVLFCPHMGDEPGCDCRKPKTGLANQAVERFPDIDLKHAVMAGDSSGDMGFGRGIGALNIGIGDPGLANADHHFQDLLSFADALKTGNFMAD